LHGCCRDRSGFVPTETNTKAVVWYGSNRLVLEDVPKPVLKPGHVLVKVKACGVCGTDQAIFAGNGPPWTRYPIVPGHELSGVIEDIGSDVDDFHVGDAVAVDNYLRCGTCWYCKNGHYFLCDHHSEIGMTINGGLGEYALVPKTNVVGIPSTLSVVDAVLTEPVATALRACRSAGIRFENKVVVLGCGPLGVLIAQIAKLMGGAVILVGRGKRLQRIRGMNVGVTIDSSAEDWAARVNDEARGGGVDVIFDVTGSEKLLYSSVGLLKRLGRLVLLGVTWGKTGEVPMDTIVLNEIRILGKVSGMGYFEEAIQLLATKKIDPALVITHKFPLERFQEAIRYDEERVDGAIKVAVVQ